jgi:hypothetical protein
MPVPRPNAAMPTQSAKLEKASLDPPALVYETAGLVKAQWRNVAIHLWSAKATAAMVMKLDELSVAFVKAHPRGVSSVHIITEGTPLPDRAVRDALRALTNKYAKNLACVCNVVEGAGFWASALHSFLTGLHFGPRDPFEVHICSTLAMAAARRIHEPHLHRTGVFLAIDDLEAALRAVRGRAP